MDLPAAAFGFQNSMILTLIVEYGESEDGRQVLANVWASQKNANSRHLIHCVTVPVCPHPDEAIVEALNQDRGFERRMSNYIREAAKHRTD